MTFSRESASTGLRQGNDERKAVTMDNPLSPVLVEITSAQRQMIMNLVHAEMTRMRKVDPNAWTTFEYAQLENMAHALYVNCAE